MKTLFDKPYKDTQHKTYREGSQKLYKFSNGYGASIVRFKLPISMPLLGDRGNYGSYTRNENEWELAVIEWEGKDFSITYDTPITDDVIGYLSEDQVENYLQQIKGLSDLSKREA